METFNLNYYTFIFTILLFTLIKIQCAPSAAPKAPVTAFQTSNSIEAKQDFMENVYADCTEKGSVPCFKYKLFAFVDKVLNKDEINLTNGITMVKTAPTGADGAPRSLDNMNENPKDSNIATMLMNRVQKFLQTRTLKVDLQGSDVLKAMSRAGRTLEELSDDVGLSDDDDDDDEGTARKKIKKAGKTLLPLLMLMKLKMMALIPIAFGIIALIAGKALIIGKIALLISLILALKKLLASHKKTVTYEIVSHPHHSSGHEGYSSGGDFGGYAGSSGHDGWGRSADGAHDLAYSAYKPKQS